MFSSYLTYDLSDALYRAFESIDKSSFNGIDIEALSIAVNDRVYADKCDDVDMSYEYSLEHEDLSVGIEGGAIEEAYFDSKDIKWVEDYIMGIEFVPASIRESVKDFVVADLNGFDFSGYVYEDVIMSAYYD